MAFDIAGDGTIKLTPLVEFDSAVIADALCALRLTLARPEDALGTGSLVVQFGMSVSQATALRDGLQKMLDHIQEATMGVQRH
jgi:hypothetical protein